MTSKLNHGISVRCLGKLKQVVKNEERNLIFKQAHVNLYVFYHQWFTEYTVVVSLEDRRKLFQEDHNDEGAI
jgi:hypothetical protein